MTIRNALISIIIITFNNEVDIEECLHSLLKQTLQNFEIVVIDNASKDSTFDIVKIFSKEITKIKLIRLNENKGFAGGNNEALKYISGKYIALLNPDTIASSTWLEELYTGITQNNDIGICASKLLVHNSTTIDSAGDGCTTTGKGFKRGENLSSALYNNKEYIFGACGGAMLTKKEVIKDIGFFDNDFFLIYEDTDFCFRAQLTGWKCLFVSNAIVYHKVRTSIGKMSDIAVYYSLRNSRFVWLKNMPTKLLFKYLHHYVLQEIANLFYFVIKHKKYKPYLKSTIDFIKAIPILLKKRKLIQKGIRVNINDIDKLITPIWQHEFLEQKMHKLFPNLKKFRSYNESFNNNSHP